MSSEYGERLREDLASASEGSDDTDLFVLASRLSEDYVDGAVDEDDYFVAVEQLADAAVRHDLTRRINEKQLADA